MNGVTLYRRPASDVVLNGFRQCKMGYKQEEGRARLMLSIAEISHG